MKSKTLVLFLCCIGFSAAKANEVLLTAGKPLHIIYRLAHKNNGEQTSLGGFQSLNLVKNARVRLSSRYDRAGIVIVSVNGHELPPTANQFDQPRQCSITTDKARSMGALALNITAHRINCRSYGGVFA